MAAGGNSQERATFKCVLCLDVFKSPKLLPCSHTFCEPCLQDLVVRSNSMLSGTFSCPSCRKQIVIPPGGVSAFQTNFYIDPEDLEKARDGSLCAVHPKLDLDWYCVDCDQVLCVRCAITDHKSHNTGDLAVHAETVTTQLCEDAAQIHQCVEEGENRLKLLQKERNSLQIRRDEIVRIICDKQNTLKMIVDKFAAEAEKSLDEAAEDIWEEDVSCLQQLVENLLDLEHRAQSALSSGSSSQLVEAAREMRRGQDMRKDLQELTQKQLATARLPLLGCSSDLSAIRELIRSLLGKAFKVNVQSSAPDVTIWNEFFCGTDSATRIFCVCPLDSGSFFVSYDPDDESKLCTSQCFDSKGKTVLSGQKAVGKASWTGRVKSTGIYMSNENIMQMTTFAKSPVVYRMTKTEGVHSAVTRVTLVSEDPFRVQFHGDFIVKCAPHRAFDVDSSEHLFAVVLEAVPPSVRRTMQLFRYPHPDPVCTYSPNMEPFQPSDVCFYTLGGREVLLVADEHNLIHVVNFTRNSLTFSHFLAPDRPLLAKPTALNTDSRGRLWVGCRDGRVLICTPVCSG